MASSSIHKRSNHTSELDLHECPHCSRKSVMCPRCNTFTDNELLQACGGCEQQRCKTCAEDFVYGLCSACEEQHGCALCANIDPEQPSPECESCGCITCRDCMVQLPSNALCKDCCKKSTEYIAYLLSLTKYAGKEQEAIEAFIAEIGTPYTK